MSARLLLSLWLGMLGAPVFAQTQTQACQALSSYKDVLQCAIQNHPSTQRSRLVLDQNQNLTGVAEQIPNPQISTQILSGKTNSDERVDYTQVNLAQPFELGGKRGSRIKKAKALVEVSEIDLQLTQEEIYLRTYLSMIRLRQISEEIEIYDDALSTFEKIQKQYRSRPRMTPEQRATYSVLDIAASDYRVRRQPLVREARVHERFLEIAVGRRLDVRRDFYPARRKDWPKISDGTEEANLKSAAIRKSQAEVEVALAELESAKSLAWPDLQIGPTFETQSQGSQRYQQLGVNISFAIPIFNLNGAGKSYANAGVSVAEATATATVREERNELNLNRQTYEEIVQLLKSTISASDLQRKHREVESSFANGIVPSSLIIEIHRQLADYTRSVNEQETSAIEALAKIYSVQGRLLSEGL